MLHFTQKKPEVNGEMNPVRDHMTFELPTAYGAQSIIPGVSNGMYPVRDSITYELLPIYLVSIIIPGVSNGM